MISMRSLLAYFWVDKPRVIYFVFCCLFVAVLALAWKRRNPFAKKVFRYIVLPSGVLLFILLNPLGAHFLVTTYETQSLRFFWLVPVSLLLALVTVYLVFKPQDRKQKVMLAVIVPALFLIFSNNFEQLRGTWENRIINWYKIPPVVMKLGDWIVNDKEGLEKSAIFPQPLNLWVRQYRPEIELPFEWKRLNRQSDAARRLYDIFENVEDRVDLCQVEYWAKEGGYNYIVLASDEQYEGELVSYQEVYRIDVDPSRDTNSYDREYILYRLTEEE